MTGGRKRLAIAASLASGAAATVVVAQALATPGSGAVEQLRRARPGIAVGRDRCAGDEDGDEDSACSCRT